MKKQLTATLLLAAVAVAGCSKEQSESSAIESSNIASFSASEIETRTDFVNNTWIAESDKIGITTEGFTTNYENIPYKANSSAATTDFSAVVEADQILYPNVFSGTATFYAYYPYNADNFDYQQGSGCYITHDISNQKDNLGGVDLMTASISNVSYGVGKDYAKNVFKFKHNLVKVVLTIKRNDNCPSLAGLAVMLEDAYTVVTHGNTPGVFKSNDGESAYTTGDIQLTVVEDAENATTHEIDGAEVTAILHPVVPPTSQTLHFTLGDNVYSVAFAPDLSKQDGEDATGAGYSYNYTIALGNDVPEFIGSSIGNWTTGGGGSLYTEESSDDAITFSAGFGAVLGDNNTSGTNFYNIDTDHNGSITYAEAAAFTGTLNMSSYTNLTSLAELIYFPNITELNCPSCTSLTKLDLSANTKLTKLYCYGCDLTELDITSCPDVGKNGGSYNSSYLLVGNQKDGGTLTLYVTQAQYDAGIGDLFDEVSDNTNNSKVTVVVK